MLFLIILLLGPVVLGAHLLGASWTLALFIGLSIPLAALLISLAVALILDERNQRRRKRLMAANRRRRGIR